MLRGSVGPGCPPAATGEAPFRSTRQSCLYPNSKWSLLLLSAYCVPGLTPHLTEFLQKHPKGLMSSSPFNREVKCQPVVTWLVSGLARMRTQVCLTPKRTPLCNN